MTRTSISIEVETKESLMKLVGALQAKTGKRHSMNDIIVKLLEGYRK